jgi:gamma-glutamyltranspeptidase/glutathione hydrolase
LHRLALLAALVASAPLLESCGGNETQTDQAGRPLESTTYRTGTQSRKAGFGELFVLGSKFSAVAADEGQAAEVGRDILQAGGNATDAAVAMFFAMAVTMPSAAGLGASGACIVHDSKSRAGEAFVFAPVAAPGAIKGVNFAVPAAVRAVTLMQVRHGLARWEMDVAPAEKLARFGAPVARALSRDLQAAGASLAADSESRRAFGMAAGGMVREGDRWTQLELAATLSAIRAKGGADFFQGGLARLMSDQIGQVGGSLPIAALRAAAPQAGPPASESYSGYSVYVAPAPMAGASVLAGWDGKAQPGAAVPQDSGGFAGLAAIDEKGGAAACALSMGQLFGARVMVPGMGFLLGAITPDSTAVSPLVIGNTHNGEVKFAGAGGGSALAAYETGAVARASMDRDHTVAAALARRAGRGGFVNAIACPDGIRSAAQRCNTANDPAGAGLALLASGR